jgi:predicted DCC family thiol-disulfide oxidoreductase YuxK
MFSIFPYSLLFQKCMKIVKSIVLIYDAKCSLCCGCMNWIKSHAIKKDVFEFIPCQSVERKSRFPEIREEACLEALHLVTPDERVLVGDKSLPEILSRLRYFRWLAIFFKMPIVSLLSYVVYRRLANNRYIISRIILPLTQEKV